jgi:hypothetical protein
MIYKLQVTTDKFIEKIYEQAMSELNEFFGINWVQNCPSVQIVNNRKTINALLGKKTTSWVIGFIHYNDICILDYKKLEQESSHRYHKYYTSAQKYYSLLIRHELVHVFTKKLNYYIYQPVWIWEGLATFAAGQNNPDKKPSQLSNFLDFYKDHENKNGTVYKESGFAVEFLVKKYGKEKLFKLIKAIDKDMSESDFAKLFKKIYGIPLEYKSFN